MHGSKKKSARWKTTDEGIASRMRVNSRAASKCRGPKSVIVVGRGEQQRKEGEKGEKKKSSGFSRFSLNLRSGKSQAARGGRLRKESWRKRKPCLLDKFQYLEGSYDNGDLEQRGTVVVGKGGKEGKGVRRNNGTP